MTREKPALFYLLKLLLLLCLLKTIFFFYNYQVSGAWDIKGFLNATRIVGWSEIYDLAVVAVINLPLLLLILMAGKIFNHKIIAFLVAFLFAILNSFIIFLNTVDIFYYRFHMQRADADLLYVLRNPFEESSYAVVLLSLAAIIFIVLLFWLSFKGIMKIIEKRGVSKHYIFSNILLGLILLLFLVTGTKKLIPTYPLIQLEAVQLPLAQNSLHCFVYSFYRRNDAIVPDKKYMTQAEQERLFSIHKKSKRTREGKNIVLFIMESVPADFFDSSSEFKVVMPFLDSLVGHSTYFSNAFSYSYNSNKGITAILAGLPTITDIPLYHSGFTSINKTALGKILAAKGYTSSFFIGDHYDDFGFAKCTKWLGIQHYYCMQDIEGYEKMEKNSLGLQDEYVLNFMQQKLAGTPQPFFVTQYNISTHYPNDLPAGFEKKYPTNHTAPMQTMQYYNECLQQFFKTASQTAWFKNTVFIFCSDHWAQPQENTIRMDEVASFRIPIFTFDPSDNKGTIVTSPVSQLDILNTVLQCSGVDDSIISYGNSLIDNMQPPNRTIYTRINSSLYQAINNDMVLGFDAITGKALYCYNYRIDKKKSNNLLLAAPSPEINLLIQQIKAFLQTASTHYRGK